MKFTDACKETNKNLISMFNNIKVIKVFQGFIFIVSFLVMILSLIVAVLSAGHIGFGNTNINNIGVFCLSSWVIFIVSGYLTLILTKMFN